MTEKMEPLSDETEAKPCGVDWLRDICEKAGKRCLPRNIDARSVLRTIDGLRATIDRAERENARLREALRDVTDALNTYGPDFVHGEPKKMVVKRARAALAETEGK